MEPLTVAQKGRSEYTPAFSGFSGNQSYRADKFTPKANFHASRSFTPSAGITKRAAEPLPVSPTKKVTASNKAQEAAAEASRQKERQAQINGAKDSLQQ